VPVIEASYPGIGQNTRFKAGYSLSQLQWPTLALHFHRLCPTTRDTANCVQTPGQPHTIIKPKCLSAVGLDIQQQLQSTLMHVQVTPPACLHAWGAATPPTPWPSHVMQATLAAGPRPRGCMPVLPGSQAPAPPGHRSMWSMRAASAISPPSCPSLKSQLP